MAVAREPIPRVYVTPGARRARALGRGRAIPFAPDVPAGPVIAGTALACIFYLWGWAQVTQANFERVQLNRQYDLLRAQHQIINSNLVKNNTKETVEAWAHQHGMVQAGTGCIYVGGAQKGM